MDFLASSTKLGILEIIEVYVQFNGPRLLACKNQSDKIFLALWVDEEEDSDLWFYMMVSATRLQAIRTGVISLHQAFSEPELDYLYEVVYIHEDSVWNTREVAVSEIEEDSLPSENTFLNCDPKTLPQMARQTITWEALKKDREVVYLVLNPKSKYPNEISSLGLGKVLSAFQPLINYLKVSSCSDLKLRLQDVARKSELNIFATSPGSFQIELASVFFETDIFGNSFAGDGIDMLFHLISLGDDASLLQEFMSRMDKKTAIKYRLFLESLTSSGAGMRLEWGSPTLTRGGSVEASFSSIKKTIKVIKQIEALEEREIEIVGELYKMDKVGWKFGLEDIKTSISYSGDVLEQAKSQARAATISELYTAKILEMPVITPVTNLIERKYKLISLTDYEPLEMQMRLV